MVYISVTLAMYSDHTQFFNVSQEGLVFKTMCVMCWIETNSQLCIDWQLNLCSGAHAIFPVCWLMDAKD